MYSQLSTGDSAVATERGRPQSGTENDSIDVDAMDEEPAAEQTTVPQVCSKLSLLPAATGLAAMAMWHQRCCCLPLQ